MRYPAALMPQTVECISLPSGRVISLPKATPVFEPWDGPVPADTYGNKPLLDLNGTCAFAELVILDRCLKAGWNGVWVDSYRGRYRTDYWGDDRVITLPAPQDRLIEGIYERAGRRGGYFDVFCWKDDAVLFAEAKRRGRDAIRATQRRWLEAALDVGLPRASLLIVEWQNQQRA